MKKDKKTSADSYLAWVKFWRTAGRVFAHFVVPGLLVFVATMLSTIGGNVALGDLTWGAWLIILGGSVISGLFSGFVLHLESKLAENEATMLYMAPFSNTSMSIFLLHKLDPKQPTSIQEFIDAVLNYSVDSVKAVLGANAVSDNDNITACLMVPTQAQGTGEAILSTFMFAPKHHLGRRAIELLLNKGERGEYLGSQSGKYEPGKTLPGAPTAFLAKVPDYVEDLDDPKYENVEYFKTAPFKSFFSIPISLSEDSNSKDKEEIFAVLSFDSQKKNHFVSYEFVQNRIYPAIQPQLALLKLMHKNKLF